MAVGAALALLKWLLGKIQCFKPMFFFLWGKSVGSDVTLRQNGSVIIRCRTMAVGAALAL